MERHWGNPRLASLGCQVHRRCQAASGIQSPNDLRPVIRRNHEHHEASAAGAGYFAAERSAGNRKLVELIDQCRSHRAGSLLFRSP